MTTMAPRMSLGKLAYYAYFRPRAMLRSTLRRGVMNSWVDNRHHQQMRAAAAQLPTLPQTGPLRRVHFLTGARFWHQTAFCAWSLARTGGIQVVPVLHDDGSLKEEDVAPLRRLFPQVEVQSAAESEGLLDQHLPRSLFPALRSRRDVYPNLKKLLDVHVGGTGWKLVLDSDMLFFRRPEKLLDWLAAPDRPCHMVDTETSYGYPLDFLSQQCGKQVAELVNVGITGLCSDQIPWDELERWTAEQNERFGPHYYQEQALIAQLMAETGPAVMPAEDYICQPLGKEGEFPTAVLHHYVAASKPAYYRYGWRRVLTVGTN